MDQPIQQHRQARIFTHELARRPNIRYCLSLEVHWGWGGNGIEILPGAAASILAGLLIFAAAGTSPAESLAGGKGHVRFPVFRSPGTTGGCGKNYDRYIAAHGHSAYATTPFNWSVEYTICGVSLNAPSQQGAEAKALKLCEAGLKKWKVSTTGTCSIAASK
ncbi:hypothetical protein ACVDG5_003925 [Mesorhizobium sp. ORM6]